MQQKNATWLRRKNRQGIVKPPLIGTWRNSTVLLKIRAKKLYFADAVRCRTKNHRAAESPPVTAVTRNEPSAVDERPPLARLLILGLQHVLVMYGGDVAVPLLVSDALHLS